jgi:DNA helicase-2/ATP-dependent DNA helicase PcrA
MSSNNPDEKITPNTQQEKVIKADEERLRVVAGPGTGKTETLIRRIAHLIQQKDVPPEEIIAFTFTEKAADELLNRIESHVGELETRPWIGTIHSFCLELLEEYRESVFDGDHTILGEEGQLVFLYTHYNDLGLDNIKYPLKILASHFSQAMDLGIDPGRYVRFTKHNLKKTQRIPEHRPERQDKLESATSRVEVAEAYKRYQDKMDETDTIDYSTMIEQAIDLVERNGDVQKDITENYSHLLVDEYQDTNRTQERLIQYITELGCDLCVVGDDDQSIYRFRGATVDNLLEFDKKYDSTRTIPIQRNYRSDEDIINSSQDLIQNNQRRLDKQITSDSDKNGFIGYINKRDSSSEASAICDYIQKLISNGDIESPDNVALLFRSVTRDANPYIDALRDRGLPIEVTGVADIFDEDLVISILSIIDYLIGDNKIKDIQNEHLFNLCDDATDDILNENSISCGHTECVGIIQSVQDLESEYDADDLVEPQELFYKILSCFPTIEQLVSSHNDLTVSKKLRHIAGLSDVISQISTINEGTRLNYLRNILSLVENNGVEPDLPDSDGGVNIMTVHQAKGLEFDTVIIPSLIEGKFPTEGYPDPLQIPSQLREEPKYKSGDDNINDERRLFYVAMTRTKRRLILSTNKSSDKSRFMQEIPDKYVTTINPNPELSDIDTRYQLRRRNEIESTSFTQISYFTQCPLRYGLLFDYGFERTEQPQFFYGISVHRALERFFTGVSNGDVISEKNLLSSLETEWISRGYKGEEQEKQFKNKAIDILVDYLQNHSDTIDQIRYIEKEFTILENNIRIVGKMDRVDKLPSGDLRVIDFKVGEAEEPGPWEAFQLKLYAMACERTLQEDVVDCRFHFLTSDEQIPIEYNNTVRRETVDRLRSVLGDMKDRKYSPSTGEYCNQCDFRGFCPAID